MKKSILFIFHDDNIYSGATMSLLKIIRYLSDFERYEITCIIPDRKGELGHYLNNLNIGVKKHLYYNQVYSMDGNFINKIKNLMKGLYKFCFTYFIAFYKIRKYEKLKNYNLIYTNTSTIYLGAWISKKYSIPHIWHIREYTEIDQNNSRCFGKNYFNHLVRVSRANLVFISNDLKEYYSWCLKSSQSSLIIYNSIDESCIGLEKERTNNVIRIIVTGTFREEKGQFLSIQSIERLNQQYNNVELYLVGKENKYSLKLREYCKKKHLENIYFLGFIKNMKPIWEKMDIGIVASKREAFGRIIIEYFVNGIVVVGSDTGAIPELIDNGETGYIFDINELESLITSLKDIIENEDKRKRLAHNAYVHGKKFCRNITNEKVLKLIDSI